MKMFNVKRLTLETMYIVLLTVTMLPVIQTDAAFDCREAMISTVRKINSWFNGYSIYQLFKHVEEEQGSGRLQTMCKTFREIQSELKHTIYPKCTASDADVHLARIAGFEHICGSGMQDYGRFGKCIDDASSKLATCKMEESDITSIKMKALYGSPDVKSNVCRDMHKYLLCSNDRIEQACGSAEAAQWYQSFVTHVFEEISYYTKMDCSFRGIHFPMWAYFVVAAGVILLLWCTCRWLHVAGLDARACTFVFGDRCLSTDSDKSKDKDRRSKSDDSIPSYAKGMDVDNLEEIVQMNDPPLSAESLYPTVLDPSRKGDKYENGHVGCNERVTVHREAI